MKTYFLGKGCRCMENADYGSLYADIRVLSELLRSFRTSTERELGRVQTLQNDVTVISTRCNDKTCAYDKALTRHEDVRESISRLESRLNYLERDYSELDKLLDKFSNAELKRLSDALAKTEDTLENTRNKIGYVILKIIPIVISIGAVVVSMFMK